MLTYSMEERGTLPLYEYLYRCIRSDILDGTLAALAGVVVTVSLRLLAWHYRWNLPRVQAPEEEKTI